MATTTTQTTNRGARIRHALDQAANWAALAGRLTARGQTRAAELALENADRCRVQAIRIANETCGRAA